MNPENIAHQRLHNQQISWHLVEKPEDVVHHMTAMQAQDYYASLWSIGVRSREKITETDVEQAIASRKIVRTWPMRGTLHFVATEDIRWMLKLLTPRVIRSSAGRHRELELDETTFSKSRNLLEKAMQGGKKFIRSELYEVLENTGISTEGQRGYHIIWYLAQTGVICQADRRGKQDTFVLLDEWIPESRELKGDEALAELAARYIKSRGPATEYDFAWWAGLTVTTARKALHLVEDLFEKEQIRDQTFWFPDTAARNSKGSLLHLLSAFDEMICGYTNRSAILPSSHEKSIILRNGIFKPMIISKGKVIGSWKRSLKKDKVIIEPQLFGILGKTQESKIKELGLEYGNFLGLKTEFK